MEILHRLGRYVSDNKRPLRVGIKQTLSEEMPSFSIMKTQILYREAKQISFKNNYAQ